MAAYFLRRFLLIIPTFFGITLMVFAITRLVPGGPVERMLAEAQLAGDMASGSSSSQSSIGAQSLSEDQIAELNKYYGFDKPILISYIDWVWKVLQLDLGYSTRYGQPVWESIRERMPISLLYGGITLILTYLISIPLGISKAINHKSIFDNATSIIVFIGYAIPSFILAILLVFQLAANLEWFPLGGFTSDEYDDLEPFEQFLDVMHHAVLPITAYVASNFAFKSFMMKNSLMDNLSADYIRTAMAKGLTFSRAVYGHALRNSLIPIATSFGQIIGVFLAGSFLIETIFNIDGIGLLGYEAVLQRDYPIVMGILVITSVLFLLGNILSDICVALVDPRVKFGK